MKVKGIKLEKRNMCAGRTCHDKTYGTVLPIQGSAVFLCSTRNTQRIRICSAFYKLHITVSINAPANQKACFFMPVKLYINPPYWCAAAPRLRDSELETQ